MGILDARVPFWNRRCCRVWSITSAEASKDQRCKTCSDETTLGNFVELGDLKSQYKCTFPVARDHLWATSLGSITQPLITPVYRGRNRSKRNSSTNQNRGNAWIWDGSSTGVTNSVCIRSNLMKAYQCFETSLHCFPAELKTGSLREEHPFALRAEPGLWNEFGVRAKVSLQVEHLKYNLRAELCYDLGLRYGPGFRCGFIIRGIIIDWCVGFTYLVKLSCWFFLKNGHAKRRL